ncbi:uncharacterized protein J8A68_000378 [[Candida] subhashii]|uniref:Uncharacterized protein n=1 Tax=[Candida] subhashii TaxID=561895 RepID=A0A8J5UUW7_9ASCO|nr:uncharacterized protein J8A68_000378 [[Candida] subhashii]KAG7666122.1 hypothetical protein J8A68_000378 [[Candida] subhashii]
MPLASNTTLSSIYLNEVVCSPQFMPWTSSIANVHTIGLFKDYVEGISECDNGPYPQDDDSDDSDDSEDPDSDDAGWDDFQFDISDLECLSDLICRWYPTESLISLKAPKQIKTLHMESNLLISLECIEQYDQLTNLCISIEFAEAQPIFADVDLPDSLETINFDLSRRGFEKVNLKTLEIDPGLLEMMRFGIRQFPPNLKSFRVDAKSIRCSPAEWEFPQSLRKLELEVGLILSPIDIPPNLIDLYVVGESVSNLLPHNLPKSLTRLKTSLLPSGPREKVVDLPNLYSLEFNLNTQELFNWQLHPNIKMLDLSSNRLGSVNLKSSDVRNIDLSYNNVSSFDSLVLPENLEYCYTNRIVPGGIKF